MLSRRGPSSVSRRRPLAPLDADVDVAPTRELKNENARSLCHIYCLNVLAGAAVTVPMARPSRNSSRVFSVHEAEKGGEAWAFL
jgi:hypothetical protein